MANAYCTQFGETSCEECRRQPPAFVRAIAYGAYEDRLREIVHLLKYHRVLPAATVLGCMLAEAIQTLELEPVQTTLIPVPLHVSRLRQRGFNQSELIAQAALRQLKRTNSHYCYNHKVLVRTRMTGSQVGLTRDQRLANIRGAFGVRNKDHIARKNLLLVDDVFTTGTTAAECARVLRRAGAQNVWVATAARVLKTASAFVDDPGLSGIREQQESARDCAAQELRDQI